MFKRLKGRGVRQQPTALESPSPRGRWQVDEPQEFSVYLLQFKESGGGYTWTDAVTPTVTFTVEPSNDGSETAGGPS